MPKSLADRVGSVVNEWLDRYTGGIPFNWRAELVSKIAQVFEEPPQRPVLQTAIEECVGMNVAAQPVEKYCVIGLDAYQRIYLDTRTLHDTPERAAEAADALVRRNIACGAGKPTKLLIVKVHSIVEKTPPTTPLEDYVLPVDRL